MGRLVVTDLTRFTNKPEHVCLAGLTLDGGHCIRPMPYLTHQQYKAMGVRPGVVLEADFGSQHHFEAPHVEDWQYRKIQVVNGFDGNLLNHVLAASAFDSLAGGFGVDVDLKHISINSNRTPVRSIVTLAVSSENFSLRIDSYGKLKADFSDASGVVRSYIPVTDIGLNHHVQVSSDKLAAIAELNEHFRSQSSHFLRIGITRPWQSDDGRSGYWLQLNAAYSFPVLHRSVEEY